MKCQADVTYGGAGSSHRCRFKAKYLAIRQTDRDRTKICGSHLNQLIRQTGWTFRLLDGDEHDEQT